MKLKQRWYFKIGKFMIEMICTFALAVLATYLIEILFVQPIVWFKTHGILGFNGYLSIGLLCWCALFAVFLLILLFEFLLYIFDVCGIRKLYYNIIMKFEEEK
jgi:hypothetical protein